MPTLGSQYSAFQMLMAATNVTNHCTLSIMVHVTDQTQTIIDIIVINRNRNMQMMRMALLSSFISDTPFVIFLSSALCFIFGIFSTNVPVRFHLLHSYHKNPRATKIPITIKIAPTTVQNRCTFSPHSIFDLAIKSRQTIKLVFRRLQISMNNPIAQYNIPHSECIF